VPAVFSDHPAAFGILAAVAAVLIVAEAVASVRLARRGFDLRDTLLSLAVALGHVLVRPLDVAVFAAVFPIAAAAAPWQLPVDRPATWIAGFLVTELSYYWMHRASHRVRWLWASHSVHHSATTFTLAAALRLAWTGVISGEWLFFLPAVLLGFPPTVVASLLAVNLVYQFVLHTELSPRWGPLERVLNTPSHHRVHHAADGAYLDRNYGGVLIVFDRLFGTFAAERPDLPPTYGIAGVAPDRDPVSVAFGEWRRMVRDLRRAGSWRRAPAILFGPPGAGPVPRDRDAPPHRP